MLVWTIQIAIISIILIWLIHYLIDFFKSTLTTPKIKDLVNTPTKQYETINQILNDSNCEKYNNTELIQPTNISMKDELKHFLKTQLTPQNVQLTDNMSYDNGDTQYSNYT